MLRVMLLAAAITAAGCAHITETGRDGTVKEYIGFMPIILTEGPGDGDVQEVEGGLALVSVGQTGITVGLGPSRLKTVWADDCMLALHLETDHPERIPAWIANPCQEGPK